MNRARDGAGSPLYTCMRDTGLDNWRISLVHSQIVADFDAQRKLEREYFDMFKNRFMLNKNLPMRTQAEAVAYRRAYYRRNSAERKEYMRQRYQTYRNDRQHTCETCSRSFAKRQHLLQHNVSNRHIRAVQRASQA